MIRIKVKHLLLIIAIVVSVLVARIYLAPRIMYVSGVTYEAIGDQNKANAMYRKLQIKYPDNQLSVKALYKRCANEFTTNKDALEFSEIYSSISTFGTSSSGQIIKPDDIDKINSEFMTIAKTAEKDEDFRKLEMVVGLMNWFGGNPDKAIELENSASYSDSKAIRDEANIYLSIMQLQMGNLTESEELLNKISDEKTELKYYKSMILNNIGLLKGETENKESIINYPSSRSTLVTINKPIPNIFGGISYKNKSGDSGLKGYIRNYNSKFSGIIIGLNKVEIFDGGGIGGSMSPEYITLVKDDGSFELKNISPGKYFVSIEAPWFQIKDLQVVFEGIENNLNQYVELESNKIQSLSISLNKNFEVKALDKDNGKFDLYWTQVPEASYYHIAIGPIIEGSAHSNDYFNATFSLSTKDTKYTLDTNKYRDINSVGYGFSNFGDEGDAGGIDANPIIGAFYQSGEYGISITAYDSRGQAISSTKPNSTGQDLTKIEVRGAVLSEADNLLIKHKYKEAISEYERLITVNPRDAHSIRMLAVLYNIGYLNDGTGKDINKAIEYYKMLDSISPSSHASLELGNIYLEKNNLTEAISYFKKVEDEYFEKNSQLLRAYFYNGDFYEVYRNFIDNRTSLFYGYKDPVIFCMYLLRGEFKEVGTILESDYYFEEPKAVKKLLEVPVDKQYQEFFEIMKTGNRSDAKEWLLKQKSSDSWRIFYEGILDLSITDKEAAKKYSNDTLKQFGNSEKDEIMSAALSVLAKNCRGF